MYKDMMFAIMSGELDKIRQSIAADKNVVTLRDKAKRTLLMEAAIFKNEDIARLLVENGADVNAKELKGWSVLHFAAQSNLPDLVKLLIEKGADINAQDDYGNTRLLNALSSFNGQSKDIIIELINAGADKDITNKSGISAYQFAMKVTNHDLNQFFK
jgi:uncharacterized protein